VELRRSQQSLASARARVPSASLSYSVSGGDADLAGSGGWSGRSSAQLSLNVPLDSWLPGSSGRVQVAEAGDALAKAVLALEETRRAAEVEIRSLVLKLQALDDHRQAGLDLLTARLDYSNALADLEQATQMAEP
jgi:outer membrane protein TolC